MNMACSEFNSSSKPMENISLPMLRRLTIGTNGADGECFRRATVALGGGKSLIRQRILHVHRS